MAGGRPTKLTEEVKREILLRIELGQKPAAAALASGIGQRTFYDWMEKAVDGIEPYASFADEIAIAERRCEALALSRFHSAASSRDLMVFLAKRFKADWGDALTIDATTAALELARRLRMLPPEDEDTEDG